MGTKQCKKLSKDRWKGISTISEKSVCLWEDDIYIVYDEIYGEYVSDDCKMFLPGDIGRFTIRVWGVKGYR